MEHLNKIKPMDLLSAEGLKRKLEELGHTVRVIIGGEVREMSERVRKELEGKSCVYIIRNKETGERYVGSSLEARGAYIRIQGHLNKTIRGQPSVVHMVEEGVEV